MDKFSKLGSDGTVDVNASKEAYGQALSAWKAENEIPTDRIETAIEAVFDRFPGQRLAMPALLSMSVLGLSATPDQHKTLTARCHAYVTGQSAGNTGRLDIGKGKGGGVLRLSLPGQPVPARPAKKSA
jgi:hypothetical protein